MNINNLEGLLELSKYNLDDREEVNDNLKFICEEIDTRGEFATKEIASATLKAYKDIVFNKNLYAGAKDHYLCSIKRILDATEKSENVNLKQVDTFILQLAQAPTVFTASIIEKIAISSIENKVGIISIFCDKDIEIDTTDTNRVALLVSALSKTDDSELIFQILKCYEKHPDIYRFDTLSIFNGKNENGTILAVNILKNMYDGSNFDELPLTNLIKLANSKSQYIPIEKAVEENVAITGIRDLKKNFPNLDMPYEEYYVKKPKEKVNSNTNDKNKSMVKKDC